MKELNKTIITAEEFFRKKIRENYQIPASFSLYQMDYLNAEQAMRWAKEYADYYAREVAQASLEKAAEKLVHFIDTYNADHSEIKLEITDEQNIVML
ncbi:hypothetical protein HZQ28_01160 [Elizabethkingia anophelis]|nr:hypothetical protein [Elizabethkingia anophelis]MCT3993096.1 hypothetical protein [Elizabethkingia anophelis]MCT3997153.1 hypothetical protein [Elizabethkingia anophelis]MCT4181762.1 hypothetical protein [Elizabethkingia anophelis]MCT4256762.1 hypothetical protein [Elizabethkingia anophelis]